MFSVSEIKGIDSDRIVGVELKERSSRSLPLFIFGVYLPANNDLVQYKICIDVLNDLETYYSNRGRVIISGDMNARYNEISNGYIQKQKSNILTSFINENQLTAVNKSNLCSGPKYTFEPCKSTLDYIIVNESCCNLVKRCSVLDNSDCSIASDHLPILTSFTFSGTQFSVPKTSITKPSPAWHKATSDQLNTYLSHVDNALENTPLRDPENSNDIDDLATAITGIMLNASQLTFPVKQFNPHIKPYWNQHVKISSRRSTR